MIDHCWTQRLLGPRLLLVLRSLRLFLGDRERGFSVSRSRFSFSFSFSFSRSISLSFSRCCCLSFLSSSSLSLSSCLAFRLSSLSRSLVAICNGNRKKKRKSTDSSVQLKSPCNVRLLSSNQKRSRTLWTVTSARRHQGYLPLPSNIPAANCGLTNLSQRNILTEKSSSRSNNFPLSRSQTLYLRDLHRHFLNRLQFSFILLPFGEHEQ